MRNPHSWPRRNRWGTDMGPPRIPPQPAFVVMTDRADGTEYVLNHTTSPYRLTLNDSLPTGVQALEIHRFGAYEGPYLYRQGVPVVRLGVRSTRLLYEVVDAFQDAYTTTPAPTSRVTFNRAWLRLLLPAGFRVMGTVTSADGVFQNNSVANSRLAFEDVTA